jgi:predicted Ser/Thr protein kinase
MGTICPSCNKIMSVLKHEGKDFRDILEVVSLDPGYEVTSFEVRPKDPKSYNALQIFGGETKLERVQAFISKDDPMVLNYGIGGIIDGPSPQRHIVHFSEMYKGGEDFMNSLLDVIQDRKLMILDRYPVHVDSVFIGTTNLDEYKDLAKLPKIGKWMTSRAVVEPVVNLLVIDDMSDALNKRVFKKLGEDIHVPPHFVRKLLAPMAVMSTIDEPKKMGISRLEKALIYNGEIPHGKEFDFEEQLKQLIDESHVKTITERTEGITNGIPFRWFQNLPMDIKRALKRVPEKNKKQLADPDHPGGCIYMTNIEKVIKDSIKMFDAINDDTRKLLLEEVIPLCYEPREKNSLFIAEMARDVNYALLGTETFTKLATKYVVQAYRDAEGKTTYYDETGVERAIDFDFLEDIEKNIGIVNPRDFRKDCANNVKLRKSDYKQLGEKKKYLDWIAERLLEENPTFRRAIENYAIEHVLPEHVPDVPTYFSSSNEKLVGELKRIGYCNACANIAINIASQLRKRSKKRK